MTILEQTYHQNTFLGALSVRPRFSCMPLHGNYSCRCVERTTKYILLSQCSTLVLITVWTVLQTVLTATFNSYGDRQISTPYKINTPEPIDKNFGTVDYVREGTSYTKFGTNPPTEGFWANWWNITKKLFLFIPFFFSGTRTGQTRGWIFTRDSSKDVKSRKDVPFGVWMMCP